MKLSSRFMKLSSRLARWSFCLLIGSASVVRSACEEVRALLANTCSEVLLVARFRIIVCLF